MTAPPRPEEGETMTFTLTTLDKACPSGHPVQRLDGWEDPLPCATCRVAAGDPPRLCIPFYDHTSEAAKIDARIAAGEWGLRSWRDNTYAEVVAGTSLGGPFGQITVERVESGGVWTWRLAP